MLGSIAGFVFIARLFKYCLEDYEYFKAKDWECDMLFGAQAPGGARDVDFDWELRELDIRNKWNERSINYSIDMNQHMEVP